ncbi:NmrA family NAD(P)-binding protein [Streptomyces canus]|uniref:NmrA family NAD(P)-binding protein n=1 Tax=Streptomyces canus TaxID=58343 RepID=UPI0033BA1759
MDKKVIALVGGTGHLGGLIAEGILARPDTQLRLLVRAESHAKVADLERRGAQIVEGATGADSVGPLAALCAGASTVISTVQGGPDVIVEGQRALLHAAREAGVRRFIPSDFTLDLFKLPAGQILSTDWRRQFAEIADDESGDVEVVSVLNGSFLDRGTLFDWLRMVDTEAQTAYVWGDGDAPVQYTTWADTALYTVEAALDDQPIGRVLPVAGDSLDFHGFVEAYEKGTGQKLRKERLGSLDDLDRRIADMVESEPQNFFAYLPLMYLRGSLRGDAPLPPLMNDRYPSIQPITVEQYFGANEGYPTPQR